MSGSRQGVRRNKRGHSEATLRHWIRELVLRYPKVNRFLRESAKMGMAEMAAWSLMLLGGSLHRVEERPAARGLLAELAEEGLYFG